MEQGTFNGVRVVELAEWVFVPVAGALLAELGADVIHVERLQGDPYRGLATQGIGSERGGVNLSMALTNRGKRSVSVDVQSEDGRKVLHDLLGSADVFLTNLRPGALDRLGLGVDAVREAYPSLVYARGHGYGVRGPDADQAGYDSSAFWSRGGMAHVLTPPDRDYPIGQRGAMGDRNGGMALAFGIAAALFKQRETGKGSVVDVSLLAIAMWTLSSDVLAAANGGEVNQAAGRMQVPNPLVGTYRTKDGRHLQLVFLQPDRYWIDLCGALDRPDLAEDPRFVDMAVRNEHAAECIAELDVEFGKRTLAECKEVLGKIDAPWAPVQAVEDLPDDPQVIANGYIGEVQLDSGDTYRLPAVPVQIDERPPPLYRSPEHGEHTEGILLELGYDWDEIIALKERGAIL